MKEKKSTKGKSTQKTSKKYELRIDIDKPLSVLFFLLRKLKKSISPYIYIYIRINRHDYTSSLFDLKYDQENLLVKYPCY